MKIIQTTVIAIVAFSFSLPVFAQKIRSTDVPKTVTESFEKAYPGVKKIQWEKEAGNYEAGFRQGSKEMSAVFNPNGSQLESEMEIQKTELPAQAITYLKQHYKGVTINEVAKIIKAGGEINYEAEVKGKDVLFDKNGQYIRIVKD